MLFDRQCRVVHNHDHALIRLHAEITPAFGSGSEDGEEEQKIQH